LSHFGWSLAESYQLLFAVSINSSRFVYIKLAVAMEHGLTKEGGGGKRKLVFSENLKF